MSVEAKLEYVASRVWSLADLFRSKARSNQKWAFRLKLLTALCSAALPVVLGLKFENVSPSTQHTTQHNIALVLGGVVALVATIDAFWGHRQLWVTYTTTATELQNLGCRIAYETNGTAVT